MGPGTRSDGVEPNEEIRVAQVFDSKLMDEFVPQISLRCVQHEGVVVPIWLGLAITDASKDLVVM